jgi:hypothetical protein
VSPTADIREDDGDDLEVARKDRGQASGAVSGNDGRGIDRHLAAIGLLGEGGDDLEALHAFDILSILLRDLLHRRHAKHLDTASLDELALLVGIEPEGHVQAKGEGHAVSGLRRRGWCGRRLRVTGGAEQHSGASECGAECHDKAVCSVIRAVHQSIPSHDPVAARSAHFPARR